MKPNCCWACLRDGAIKRSVFHPFVRSHQGAILPKALGGGINVLWTHFFSSFFFFFFLFKISIETTVRV